MQGGRRSRPRRDGWTDERRDDERGDGVRRSPCGARLVVDVSDFTCLVYHWSSFELSYCSNKLT